MARGPKKWDESTIDRFQLEGRGKGHGCDYKPWITVRDISSTGNSHRIWGIKTQREHHLFSNVERDIFIYTEWLADVIDIREQFPIDRDLTLEIAAASEIQHPYYPGTMVPTVMTVDFLLSKIVHGKQTLIALNGKRDEEAENENSLAKLEIQRRYFAGMGIPHHVIFHSKIPQHKVQNIMWFRNAMPKPGEEEPYQGFFHDHQERMASELLRSKRDSSLADYCLHYDSRHGIETGMGLRIAKMLMFSRALLPDLANPDLASAPLSSFIFTARPGKLRAIS